VADPDVKPDEYYVLKIEGGVPGVERLPELQAQIGRYIANYEPQLVNKGQWLATTEDPDQALGFPDLREVHAFLQQDRGTRWDGKKDRPITAFHLSVARRKEFK